MTALVLADGATGWLALAAIGLVVAAVLGVLLADAARHWHDRSPWADDGDDDR